MFKVGFSNNILIMMASIILMITQMMMMTMGLIHLWANSLDSIKPPLGF